MEATAEVFGAWRVSAAPRDDDEETSAAAQSSDFALARRAARGDMAAFEEVYRRHHRRVYSLCLRMLCNAPEAEDLTQDVFVHLFRAIGGFRGESTLTTWLHRLTVNQVLMHFRRKKTRKKFHVSEGGEGLLDAINGDEVTGRTPALDQLALSEALAKLPPGYRTVLILHDVEGYEHEEIARLLGCAVGTSKSQLHKARLRVRKLLGARTPPRSHVND
ncbi:MAG TPA: RNA polymerase sigma factor [Pyrinomonadaceae bacterium]|jgi:RNA polymerase sigma-70 factor (ECF subfamily)|nr:RNA polymerase sigma factor [Pyrinomonadaceae bacterium]